MTHHVNCIPQNRRRSNYALRDHQEFEARVFPQTNPLTIPWSLGCVGCCHAYLLSREYSPHVNVFMADDVVFTFPILGNTIDCFVRDSDAPNPAHGQLATNPVSGTVVRFIFACTFLLLFSLSNRNRQGRLFSSLVEPMDSSHR
jgi:hypothetical protein